MRYKTVHFINGALHQDLPYMMKSHAAWRGLIYDCKLPKLSSSLSTVARHLRGGRGRGRSSSQVLAARTQGRTDRGREGGRGLQVRIWQRRLRWRRPEGRWGGQDGRRRRQVGCGTAAAPPLLLEMQ